MSNGESLVSVLAQFGGTAVFGGLIFMLLKNQLSEARQERTEAREERNAWLRQINDQEQARHKAMGQLSEVLVEIRTILKERNHT